MQQQRTGNAVKDAVVERQVVGSPLAQRHLWAVCKPTPGACQHLGVAVKAL